MSCHYYIIGPFSASPHLVPFLSFPCQWTIFIRKPIHIVIVHESLNGTFEKENFIYQMLSIFRKHLLHELLNNNIIPECILFIFCGHNVSFHFIQIFLCLELICSFSNSKWFTCRVLSSSCQQFINKRNDHIWVNHYCYHKYAIACILCTVYIYTIIMCNL